jgi:hypothetical protein
MLEWIKALGAMWTEQMYFAHDKDMNFGQLEAYCFEVNCVTSSNLYVETLIAHVTVLVIEFSRWLGLKEVRRVVIWYIGTDVPIKVEEPSALSDLWRQNEKAALQKPGRELLPLADPASTLILDLTAFKTVGK